MSSTRSLALTVLLIALVILVAPPHFTTASDPSQKPAARILPNNPASFTLFGRINPPAGWGFLSSSVASPGPDITVVQGDTVTITLNSGDSPVTHNWGVDYNGNGIVDAGEPFSGGFSTSTTLTFTATTKPGTYTYWCFIHKGPMTGRFIVAASFTLYGKILAPAGWGTTPSTVSSPGPFIDVFQGETVTLQLASADGVTHDWGVDYNNNNICDSLTEPCSASFGSTQISFTFTALAAPGNYTYKCFIHLGPMFGTYRVKSPHDVGASRLTTPRNTAYSGVTANPVPVNVTALNTGFVTDTFAVYAKANTTLIGNVTVTLAAGTNQTVTFAWNPQLLARGNYVLTANATRVTGETNFANNQLTGGVFFVRLRGDVSGDCRVDIVDLSTVGANFGKSFGTPGFNSAADLNNDGTVNIVDLVLVAGSFGQVCT